MQYQLTQYKENMYANFWLVPFIMSLLAIFLAFLTLYLDHSSLLTHLKTYLNIFIDVNSSKEVLSVIATSVITITSVTFSITVLILSITSNQWGSRLLPNFMRQKSTQIVLGFFIGTFVYSIIILELMSIDNSHSSAPYISLAVGMLLGIISFFLLIYFIHFVCHVIQVDNVLTYLIQDITSCLERQFPNKVDAQPDDVHHLITKNEAITKNNFHDKNTISVISNRWGYIQTIDYKKLLKIAEENSILIHLHHGIGQFVFYGLPLISIHSNQPLKDNVKTHCLNAIQIGRRRSTVQDVEFAFEELSEVALRALSPGVNNPYTAIHCLDRMAQGFAILANKKMLSRVICNKEGKVRIIRQVISYHDIVSIALNRLRQQAQSDLSVTIYILIMIEKLLVVHMPDELHQALFEQATLVYEDCSKKEIHSKDRADLTYYYEKIKDTI